MSYSTIVFDCSEGLASLALNRPEHRNRLNAHMLEEMRDALKRIHADARIRAVLLTGAGRDFCTGHDLPERHGSSTGEISDLGALVDRGYNPLVRTLTGLDMPVVCAVNGLAAGAGMSLALACDIVLAARSAHFLQPTGQTGLVPDAGGTWLLPHLVGHARALGLALLSEPLEAGQAAAWGMIWRVVDDDRLHDSAVELARRLASGPTRGLALTKRALYSAGAHSLDQQLDVERDYQRRAGRSEDYREAVTARREGRKPHFRGH